MLHTDACPLDNIQLDLDENYLDTRPYTVLENQDTDKMFLCWYGRLF